MTTNVSPWCIFTIHHLKSSPILVMDFTPKKFIEDIVVEILDQVSLFHCDKCSKHFTKKESLKRHNKNVHNLDFLTQNHFFLATLLKDEKEYSCPNSESPKITFCRGVHLRSTRSTSQISGVHQEYK